MISILQTSRKDRKYRAKYRSSELHRRYYKLLKIKAHHIGFIPLHKLPKIQLRNYCLISGRARSVYSKKLRLSRHQIKGFFLYVTGLKSSSW